MGIFANIGSAIPGLVKEIENESPAQQPKKNGFSNFSSDMERLRNYDPKAELEKAILTRVGVTNPPGHQTKLLRK